MQLAQAADVIDVRVRANDDFYGELMAPEKIQDAIYFVPGVHHQRFARDGIANDRAIALQHPYGDGDVNQSVRGGIERRPTVAHKVEYSIGGEAIWGRRCIACPVR
jgi:hypothetical protein